jgi:transposase
LVPGFDSFEDGAGTSVLGDDRVSGFCPCEGLWLGVAVSDPVVDGGFKLLHALEYAATDALAQGVETHVVHASSVAVTREHRRAKTDRLDTELLKRGFLGWLRGERGHCKMVAVPTLAEEDAKRPSRERETLVG